MKAISSSVKNTEKTSEQALAQEKVADVAELVAEKKQTAVVTEDKNSGLNTDEKADELIAATKEKPKKLAPSMLEQYGIASSIQDAMCPCKQELSSIANAAQACYNALFNIFNMLDSGKISVVSKRSSKKAQEVREEIKSTGMLIPQVMKPILNSMAVNWKQGLIGKELVDTKVNTKISDYPYKNKAIKDVTNYDRLHEQYARQLQQEHARMNQPYNTKVAVAEVLKSLENQIGKETNEIFKSRSIFGRNGLFGRSRNAQALLSMNEKELERISAERADRFGLTRSDRLGATGAKAQTQYFRTLLGKRWRQNENPFENITISEGVEVNTDEITKALQKAIQDNMFTAQTGGWFRNLIGPMTLYAGQPSLEKSRAQIEGLNQIMSNIRQSAQKVLEQIKSNELTLRGLKAQGKGDTAEAGKLSKDIEDRKLALRGILADAATVNQIVEKTGKNTKKIIQQLGFASPELRDSNVILQNINSGLDKNGKALKFQTRTAEVLNYTFRKMARSVGQMIERWILMLNPINLIKRAFQDFTSYNVKWQRTMNVIKYNIHSILEPFMDKIAQFLVNCIGFIDIISMKVQEAFGHIPISLFDQAAADARKIHEELEAAANVSAGFDELHDIGSDNSGANDLFGDIYKPQLPESWKKLAEEIGDLFAGLIRGDLGFGEVMQLILKILWDTLKTIAQTIWDWFKQTAIGKYITEHWKDILGTVLKIFIAWELLKIAGKLLWNALFSNFTVGAGTSLLKNLFTDTNGIVGIGKNIGTLISGAILAVLGTMAVGDAINKAWKQGNNDALLGKEMNLNDTQTNLNALQGALGGATAVIGGGMIATALGASVALGPLLAVAAGVAALAAVVVVGAEAWAYHAKQTQIANNEMLSAEEYATQAADTQEKLQEATELVNKSLEIKNTHQEKLNELERQYGISLETVIAKVDAAGGSTESLTANEKALYEQGKLTQQSLEKYNKLLELQNDLQNKLLWQKEQEAIALDVEAGNYELAATRIELAELQGVATTEDATKKRIQLYKEAGETERENLLQNLTPEQRALMLEYNNATSTELGNLAKIWQKSSETVKEALLEGVGKDTQEEFKRRMNDITNVVKQHTGFWQGVGDTLKEIISFGNWTTWTYNGQEKYYSEGYGQSYKEQRINEVLHDNTLSEEEKKNRLRALGIKSYAVGTNYVPNNGLAYLHQGEAVVPKQYNQPYNQGLSNEERAYMQQMMATMRSLDGTMKQGLKVNGEFRQRGSDLVAIVNKTKSQYGADLLSNVSYAR